MESVDLSLGLDNFDNSLALKWLIERAAQAPCKLLIAAQADAWGQKREELLQLLATVPEVSIVDLSTNPNDLPDFFPCPDFACDRYYRQILIPKRAGDQGHAADRAWRSMEVLRPARRAYLSENAKLQDCWTSMVQAARALWLNEKGWASTKWTRLEIKEWASPELEEGEVNSIGSVRALCGPCNPKENGVWWEYGGTPSEEL